MKRPLNRLSRDLYNVIHLFAGNQPALSALPGASLPASYSSIVELYVREFGTVNGERFPAMAPRNSLCAILNEHQPLRRYGPFADAISR